MIIFSPYSIYDFVDDLDTAALIVWPEERIETRRLLDHRTIRLCDYVTIRLSDFIRHLEHFRNFLHYALALLFVIALNCSDDAGIEMVFQNSRADLVQRGLHGLYLADHINAVRVLLHHADDAAQVAFHGFQSSERAFRFHVRLVFLPPPRGDG